MGNWSFVTLPATSQQIAVDVVAGSDIQVMKIDSGTPGNSNPVSEGNALPFYNDGLNDVDLGHYLEPLQNLDASGRIQVGVPAAVIASGTITTVASITADHVTDIAGIGIEQFINQAETAYNMQIATGLVFS